MNLPPNLRAVFVSHGAPTLALASHPAADFLRALGAALPRPRSILLASPHWTGSGLQVKAPPRFSTWHDFGGFGPALHALRYEPPGAPEAAQQVLAALAVAGHRASLSADTRLDHGAWVPLSLMFPAADIPLVQLSVAARDTALHYALGQALAPLAADGLLVLGSGSFVHNLGALAAEGTPLEPWATAFEQWMDARLLAGDWPSLLRYRSLAPHAAMAHPSEEHLLPLFVAGGAGGAATRLHQSYSYGNLAMAAYGF